MQRHKATQRDLLDALEADPMPAFASTKMVLTFTNIAQVFELWCAETGFSEVDRFYAEVCSAGCIWREYHAPATESGLDALRACRDSLTPLQDRRLRGEFFTPPDCALKGHLYLERHLNASLHYSWWDMACGTGNLLHGCPEDCKVYASTLGNADVEIIQASPLGRRVAAFEFDFLNRPDSELPSELLSKLTSGEKWVWIVNPPYASRTAIRSLGNEAVADTHVASDMASEGFLRASNSTAIQFLYRIAQMCTQYELDLTVGLFSPATFITSPGYASFYQHWNQVFGFLGGFCVSSEEFGGTTGVWPLLFSVWRSGAPASVVTADVFLKERCIGVKEFGRPSRPLNEWVKRQKNTEPAIPMTSAMKVYEGNSPNLDKLPKKALGFVTFPTNDVMHSKSVFLLSTAYANGGGWGVSEDNFEHSLIAAGARSLIKGTWLNDRDGFSVPEESNPLYGQFKRDLIAWFLFSNFNHSVSLTGLKYQGVDWDVRNPFFWMTSKEMISVGAMTEKMQEDCQGCSESFVADWFSRSALSDDCLWLLEYGKQAVLSCAKQREEASQFQIDTRWDAGWYQIRKATLWNSDSTTAQKLVYQNYKRHHAEIGRRLTSLVYDLGMLPLDGVTPL